MAGNGSNLAEILSHYPVALFQVERDGLITLAEGGAIGALGLEEARSERKPLWGLQRDIGWLVEAARSAFNGANVSCEGRTGERIYEMVLHPELDRTGRIIGALGFGCDVTERLAAERERDRILNEKYRFEARLARSLELESEVFSLAHLGVFILDTQFRYSFCNRYQLDLFDCTTEQLLGRRPWEVRPELTREALEPLFTRVLGGEVTQGALRQYTRADGTITWAVGTYGPLRDSEGRVTGIIVLVRDLTAQLEAEMKAQRSEENFRGLMDNLPDAVGVAVDGVIADVNRAAYTRLGFGSREELLGRSLLDMFPSTEARDLVVQRVLCVSAGEPSKPIEQSLATKTGGKFVAEISSTRVVFNGRPALLGVARDLTEYKKLQAQVLISERMASMGALTAGVGHEINNPLASVLGNLDLVAARLEALLSEGRLPSAVADLVDPVSDARQAAGQIRDIVRDLRLFSKGADVEDVRPVNLTRILDSTLRMARNEIKHRARLMTDYQPVPLVNANESRLAQVFLNLIVNAVQALPDGHAQSNEVRVVTRTYQGQAMVEVHDTGEGMSPEVVQRLFSPFFTTKHEELGIGLGLVICQRIVTDLNGSLEVESEPGKGSIFRILLPPATEGAVLPTPRPSPLPEACRPGKVLVIDDEPAIGRVIKRILSPYHQVIVMDNASCALERINSGEAFDVILCDLMMPQMNGMDFFTQLSDAFPEIASKVVFLTGGAFTPASRAFLATVPNGRLDKPFGVNALRSVISKHVGS